MAGRLESPSFVPVSLQLLDNRFTDVKETIRAAAERHDEASERLTTAIGKLEERISSFERNFLKYAAVILTILMGGDAAMKALGVG